MSIPRPDINEESELDHRITVRELGPIGFAQAWNDDEIVDRALPKRLPTPYREYRLWEIYGLEDRYWAYRLVH